MSLLRLKWFAIVAPVTFLVVVGYLVRGPFHEELHHYPSYVYVLGVLTIAVSGFSFLVFGIIGRVERRMLEQNDQLAALLAVGQAASSSLELADVLDAGLDSILAVTSAEAGEVWLVTAGGELVLTRQRGAVVDPGFETFRAQPLIQRGETVGVLTVASRSREALASTAERRLLEGIGRQLVIAVENAQLHERVLDAVVLEERERLARELHDGLAQVLGYVNMQTLAIEKLLASGRREEAEEQVVGMREASKRVYTDVREAILGLRSTRGALLPTLRSYISDYGRMTGLPVELDVAAEVEGLRLAPSVEIQLARILQEALSNVRKHARASSATVSLDVCDGKLAIEIADDGRGFDMDQPVRTGWPRFGLQTMRERAQAIGGTFELWSRPTAGTRVAVQVPLGRPAEVSDASPAR